MSIRRRVKITGSMHPTRALELYERSDGDVIVVMTQDGEIIGEGDTTSSRIPSAQIAYCVSGGKRRHTHAALLFLMEAMEMDIIEQTKKG